MRWALWLLLLPLTAVAAEHDHSVMPMPTPVEDAAVTAAMHTTMLEHGGMLNYLLQADRFERQYQSGDEKFLWDAQAWFGGDYDKLWVKTEGEWSEQLHEVEHSKLQLLYSHAVAPFWDLQAGVRHDDGIAKSRDYAVIGLQGLAPYWFAIDSAVFVSERGKLLLHLEAEYELRLTQKLLLQPRVQLNHAFANDKPAGIEKGLFDSNIALRLRYEFAREFAPYIGVERDIGGNRPSDDARIVVGMRFWY